MAKKNTKRKRKPDMMVLKLILMVAAVLIIFEGKLVITMFSQHSTSVTTVQNEGVEIAESEATVGHTDNGRTSSSGASSVSRYSSSDTLAGLPALTSAVSDSDRSDSGASSERKPTVSDPDSPSIVPKAAQPVDDSYFSDAVFIRCHHSV